MGRESNYQGYMKHGDALTIPFYNVDSASVFLERIDGTEAAGSATAIVNARVIMPKSYTYDSHLLYLDVPAAMYGFPLVNQISRVPLAPFSQFVSTAAAPLESLSGRAVALSGGNLINGNYTVARLAGYYLMVPPTVQVQDTFVGISAQENAGLPWTVEAWVFRNSATASTLYIEANAGFTVYLSIQFDAAGHILVTQTGVTRITSLATVGLGGWHHIAVVYTGTQIITYIDGVAAAAIAYTHMAIAASTLNRINSTAPNVHYTQSLTCYGKALVADDVARHYREITDAGGSVGDFSPSGVISIAAAVGLYGGATILFSNNVAPNTVIGSGSVPGALVLPLLGVGQIYPTCSVTTDRWFYSLRIVEKEGVE